MTQSSDPGQAGAAGGGPPAGWYPDPSAPAGRTGQRYWDGSAWTGHVVADPAAGYGGPGFGGPPTTPDGVLLAGWWQRVGAYLIDGLVIAVPTLVIGFPFLRSIAHQYRVYIDAALDASRNGTRPPGQFSLYQDTFPALIGFALVTVVIGLAYQVIMLRTRSATLGKLALGLRVRLRDTPGPLTWSTIGRRVLAQFGVNLIGWVPFVGALTGIYVLLDVLWPLWDEQKQSLHDKFARTNVVQHRP